ncbi:hypothetical protein [Dactylosporangium sp. NPDC051541]|uniref:hypothetical protein n=1 Tax=Dactylosporangium sp. NPDC051541 TaxID=3363977 RepID=UPI0037B0CF00
MVAWVRTAWERSDALPEDLDVLRARLFFEQRRHYCNGGLWDFTTEPFVAAVLARIRALAVNASVPLRSARRRP